MAFPTLVVKDGTLATQTINTLPNAGQATKANSLPVVLASDSDALKTAGPGASASTSTPLTGTVSDTTAHSFGPFTPQLARDIWLTVNITAAATGTVQLLRSTDAGTTLIGLTAGGDPSWANFTLNASTGVLVNESIVSESDASAVYYLNITLTAGTLTYRVAQ